MFEAIAAVVSGAMNLGGNINNAEQAKYQRYINDRNLAIYSAQQQRNMRGIGNLALIIGLILIVAIGIYFVTKK